MTVNFSKEQKFLDTLSDIIEANFANENFGVSELAQEMGLSHSSLHRKLKAIVRQSISQFIRETRLKRAMELLKLQAGTVSEVAFGVGFGSTTYFSKCFHDYFGYPPGEVKKRFVPEHDAGINLQDAESESRIESIVVLPFDNYTGDETQAYLAFGMHDTLISELGQLGALRVVSKTSALCYLNSKKRIKEIASELNVDAIIEASVLSIGESIKVQLKLIRALPEEKQLWTQTYDVDLTNILKLYSQIIKEIAGEIKLNLTPAQQSRLDGKRAVHPESYKAYLLGMYNLNLLTPEGMQKGLEYLHEAVRIAPSEPFAYAGLALGYLEIAHGFFDPGDSYIKAEEAAMKGYELNIPSAEIYTALAELNMYALWKFEEAEAYYKKAIALNPNFYQTHYHYSWALFLFGRMEEAVAEHELAQQGDPLNPLHTSMLGALYCYAGRHEDAIREARKSLEIQKDYPFGYWTIGEAYLAMGREDEAIEAHLKLAEVAPWFGWALGHTYAVTNRRSEAEKILVELEKTEVTNWTALARAVLYGALGRMDEAFHWLGYEPHHLWIPWVAVMPMWKPLRADARYDDFVKALNIPH
ncbi:MAG: helix-turn-helix domain-containing protein [Bacteroidota bacterium]